MHTATCTLKSVSPYSQSRPHAIPREGEETSDAHEKRTWPARIHAIESGEVFIPPMAFKNCLSEAAQFRSRKIPGKGNSTYTKHFVAGLLVTDPVFITDHDGSPIMKSDVEGEELFVPSDGKRGGGKRVWKTYPKFPEWTGDVVVHVLDDLVTEDIFTTYFQEGGKFIGVGRFRPINNGYYGRFSVEKVVWE